MDSIVESERVLMTVVARAPMTPGPAASVLARATMKWTEAHAASASALLVDLMLVLGVVVVVVAKSECG